jgi:4-amino-4-deoxychorismate lyase
VRVVALLDGTVADPDRPLLHADDLGVLRGDGVFETLLVVDGRPRNLAAHLARLARSAAMLDLPEPDAAAWRACVGAACAAWCEPGEMALKLVLTRGRDAGCPAAASAAADPAASGADAGDPAAVGGGPVTGYAIGLPVPELTLRQRRDGVRVLTLDRGHPAEPAEREPWLLIGAKTLSYATNMAALRYARAHGADDVVYVTADGWVLEGPTASVVIATGRTLRTPPVSAGLLPGITQQELFQAAEAAGWTVKTEPLRVPDLHSADGVWLASSVRQLVAVHHIDGTPRPVRPALDADLRALLASGVFASS